MTNLADFEQVQWLKAKLPFSHTPIGQLQPDKSGAKTKKINEITACAASDAHSDAATNASHTDSGKHAITATTKTATAETTKSTRENETAASTASATAAA